MSQPDGGAESFVLTASQRGIESAKCLDARNSRLSCIGRLSRACPERTQ
jgi:hypothetical protein